MKNLSFLVLLSVLTLTSIQALDHGGEGKDDDPHAKSKVSPAEAAQKKDEQAKTIAAVDTLLAAGTEVKGPKGEPTPLGNFIRIKGSAFIFIDEPAKLALKEAIDKVKQAKNDSERAIATRGAMEKIASGSSDFAIVAYNAEKKAWYYADLTKSLKAGAAGVQEAIDNPLKVADARMAGATVTSGGAKTGSLAFEEFDGKPTAVFQPKDGGKALSLEFDSEKKTLVPSWN